MDAPRILILTRDVDISDATTYTLNLVRGLSEAGARLQLICRGGTMLSEFETIDRLEIRRSRFLFRRLLDPFQLHDLIRRLTEVPVDLIHAQGLKALPGALKLARKVSVPVVVTNREMTLDDSHIPLTPNLRAILTFNEKLRVMLVNRKGAPKELIRVVPTGVDLSRPRRTPRGRGESALKPVIGTFGNLSDSGYETLLKAVLELRGRGVNCHLLVVGKHKESQGLTKQARELQLYEHMCVVTQVTDFGLLLAEMDVFVSPLNTPGLGQSLLEAMGIGVPVVAVGTGPVFELLKDEETGLIVPRDTPSALADAIGRCLDDSELALRLSERGHRFVTENFDLSHMIDDTMTIYRRVITEWQEFLAHS